MNTAKIADFVEDIKRPVRNLAVKIGALHPPTNQELVARHGPVVTYHDNQFDLTHPRCNAIIAGSIIKNSYEKMEIAMIREYVRV